MKRLGLASKLIAAVCTVCILFTALFLFVQINLFQTAFQVQQNERLKTSATAAQDYIHLYMQQIKSLVFSAAIREELKSQNPDMIKTALRSFVDQTAASVHFAFFVDTSDNIYCSNHIVFRVVQITMDYTMPLQIVRGMPSGNSVYVSEPYRSSTSTLPAIAFAKRIYDRGHYIGSVLLEINLENACNTLRSATNLQGHSFLVKTWDGQKVFGYNSFPIAEETVKSILNQQQKWASYRDEQGQYRAFKTASNGLDWNIILIADESILYESLQNMILRIALISVGLLLSLMLVVITLVNRFTVPLRRLAEVMNGLGEKDLTLPKDLETNRYDEVGDLTRSFQELLNRIRQLLHAQHETERARASSEIRALQDQLRPHFLYNTLNTFSALVMDGKAHKIPSAISALIHLLANCTDKIEPFVSLADELQTTQYYLDIMKLRYGDRFDVTIQVPEHLLECTVPKLVLQPLVENAVFHGLYNITSQGMLEIEASVNRNGDLLLSVLDDGNGIPADKMATILTDAGDAHSTGLRNTHSRIRLYFGEQYGLHIESIQGIGTRVEVVLPLRHKDSIQKANKEELS